MSEHDTGEINAMLPQWLSLATSAVERAGRYLADDRGRRKPIVVAQQFKDVKLEADQEAESLILDTLGTHSTFPVLTEERGLVETNESLSGMRWIVDPLDGSVNYATGIPIGCVSIGLWREDAPLLGAVYDFYRNELFTGVVGLGAWLNRRPIHVSGICRIDEAVLCTGFPVGTDFSPNALADFVAQVRRYRKVRLLGSAALSLAYVAVGRADAYCERDVKLWDVAGGMAIVCAAGGQVTWTASGRSDAGWAYAGGPALPAWPTGHPGKTGWRTDEGQAFGDFRAL